MAVFAINIYSPGYIVPVAPGLALAIHRTRREMLPQRKTTAIKIKNPGNTLPGISFVPVFTGSIWSLRHLFNTCR